MRKAPVLLIASVLMLAACGTDMGQRFDSGADETAIGGQAWPYGQRDPAYRTGDGLYPWPLGQDALDP
jgi:hypothetical protein